MKQKKLVAGIKEEIQFEESQKNLKEKHHIEDPNVVVIERNNFIKFFIQTGARILRMIATIVLLFLAVIGLITFIYPSLRSDLFLIIKDVQKQLIYLLGW
jgi:hypothetical protein